MFLKIISAMKNDYVIISLLTMLFLVELSNQYWMMKMSNRLKDLDKKATEFFEPILPEWEEEQEVK